MVSRLNNTQEEPKEANVVEFYCMGSETKFKLERKISDYSNFLKTLLEFEENRLKLNDSHCMDCQWIFLENQFNYDITHMANFEY